MPANQILVTAGQSLIDRSLASIYSGLDSATSNVNRSRESFGQAAEIMATPKQTAEPVLSTGQPTVDDQGKENNRVVSGLLALAQTVIVGAFAAIGGFGKELAGMVESAPDVLTGPARQPTKMDDTSSILQTIATAEGTSDQRAQQKGFESGYDVPYGYGQYVMPEKPLSQMTLNQVKQFQRQQIAATRGKIPGTSQGTGAVGKYQITQGTLERLTVGMDPNTIFSPELQDQLATRLIEEASGRSKGDPELLADNLAKIWASLPTSTGQGYYAGQRAGITRDEFIAVVSAMLDQPTVAETEQPARPSLQDVQRKIDGEKLNAAGDPESENSNIQVIMVPIQQQGGAGASDSPAPSNGGSQFQSSRDRSGSVRVLGGLNAL